MKIKFSLLLVAMIAISGCSQKDRASSREGIGEQVMGLLHEMGDITQPEFSEYFLSVGELHEIARDTTLVTKKEQRDALLKTTKSKLKTQHKFMYRRIKRKGERLGINWSRIEFKKFDAEMKIVQGSQICAGKLQFTYKKNTFQLSTSSVYDGENYILVGLGGLMSSEKLE